MKMRWLALLAEWSIMVTACFTWFYSLIHLKTIKKNLLGHLPHSNSLKSTRTNHPSDKKKDYYFFESHNGPLKQMPTALHKDQWRQTKTNWEENRKLCFENHRSWGQGNPGQPRSVGWRERTAPKEKRKPAATGSRSECWKLFMDPSFWPKRMTKLKIGSDKCFLSAQRIRQNSLFSGKTRSWENFP